MSWPNIDAPLWRWILFYLNASIYNLFIHLFDLNIGLLLTWIN